MNKVGVLYIVATPIGNLLDMSSRAIDTLRKVDLIAAEDTRHSAYLLKHFAISTPSLSLHNYNERDRVSFLLEKLQNGSSIALISDAGTPLISDPGYHLVHEVKKLEIKVVPIPGPCAAIAALCASGLPTDRFIFEGFLPVKTKARKERLSALARVSSTLIFYEAPHRIKDLLKDMQAVWGSERKVTIARELTKIYETIREDFLDKIIEWMEQDKNQQKGEIVVLVEGIKDSPSKPIFDNTLKILLKNLPLKQAVEIAEELTGQKKNILYDRALEIKNLQKNNKNE